METSHSLAWRGAGLTDVGKIRSTNQDAFGVDNQFGLWIVADGMGGRAGGGVASQIVVDSVMAYFRLSSLRGDSNNSFVREKVIEELRAAIRASDVAIRKAALDRPEYSGMGTTLVIVLLCSGPSPWFALAHVGDSRAYLVRSHQIMPLTRDHSVVQDLVNRGLISPEEALNHPRR